ncbi:VOC family protein [Mitsuaria sp. GD03876]|uniref:VOC family protein n=1 Tax=Mitsuaria sp. GD03876 TaxID=2975399 RepID=UPI00244AE289|nr:VOC family protein [Mitsuaria sp. GD03876]MDH0863172.1 VOC family protein [Mitsuaria sp. GD03876]
MTTSLSPSAASLERPAHAEAPRGLNHLVLTVSDIEASHRFYTELIGFRHVATSNRVRADGLPPMRFYSGHRDGKDTHHDLALYQLAEVNVADGQRLDHLAIEYASEASWREQIRFLQSRGVTLHDLVERGATWSIHARDPDGLEIELVFERPRSEWEDDIQAAVNRAQRHPLP